MKCEICCMIDFNTDYHGIKSFTYTAADSWSRCPHLNQNTIWNDPNCIKITNSSPLLTVHVRRHVGTHRLSHVNAAHGGQGHAARGHGLVPPLHAGVRVLILDPWCARHPWGVGRSPWGWGVHGNLIHRGVCKCGDDAPDVLVHL